MTAAVNNADTSAGRDDEDNAVHVRYELATPLRFMKPTTPFLTGTSVLSLLDKLAVATQREAKPRRVAWQLLENVGGTASFRPTNQPDLAERAAVSLVEGFAAAERDIPLHKAWDQTSAGLALNVAATLGDTATTGLRLIVGGGGLDPIETTVTRAAARHLTAAIKQTIVSYGTVIGILGGASARPYRRASLWSDVDGRRVDVRFGGDLVDEVRQAWAHEHVEITGLLYENSVGQILKIDMQSLRIIESDGPTWADIAQGSYPGLTGGLSPAEYLEQTRGRE